MPVSAQDREPHDCPEWGRCPDCGFRANWRRWRAQFPAMWRESFAELRQARAKYRAGAEEAELEGMARTVEREHGG